jgi:hypothetical protein
LPDVLSELANGYRKAGSVIADAGGRLDVIALGEWIHGGDVRAALGAPRPGRAVAILRTSGSTLMRIVAGRQADPADYQLAGASAGEIAVF